MRRLRSDPQANAVQTNAKKIPPFGGLGLVRPVERFVLVHLFLFLRSPEGPLLDPLDFVQAVCEGFPHFGLIGKLAAAPCSVDHCDCEAL